MIAPPFFMRWLVDPRPKKRYRVYLSPGESYEVPDDEFNNIVTVRTYKKPDTILRNGDKLVYYRRQV